MYTKGLNKSFLQLTRFSPKNKYDKIWHNKDMNYMLQNKNGHTVVDI